MTNNKQIFKQINPQGAIFDMDGTILDSLSAWASLSGDFLKAYHIQPTKELNSHIESLTLEEVAHFFAQSFDLGVTGSEIFSQWQEEMAYKYQQQVTCIPGVKNFLESLSKEGVSCCVATLTDKHLAEKALARWDLLKYMQFIITVEDVGKPKSNPQIYQDAATRLARTPEHCMVFEDALYAILSAKGGGFPVCAVLNELTSDRNQMVTQNSDLAIHSFQELI